jgi:hypothetical protein
MFPTVPKPHVVLNNTQFSVLSSKHHKQSLILKHISELMKKTFKEANILRNPLSAMHLHETTCQEIPILRFELITPVNIKSLLKYVTSHKLVYRYQGSPETESIYQTTRHHILADFNAKAI